MSAPGLGHATFDVLVGGPGDRNATSRLLVSRRDRTLVHLSRLMPRLHEEARDLILAADERNREAVREVLTNPLVQAWTSRSVKGLRGVQGAEPPTQADLDHVGGVAVAAALAAGVDGEVRVPVRSGLAFTPGIGAVRAGAVESVRLSVRQGDVRLAGKPVYVERVRRVRLCEGAVSSAVIVDDLDPYRGGYHVPTMSRLTPLAFGRWESLIREAWALLWTVVPAYADASSGIFHTMVPLRAGGASETSATLHDTFGAIGLTEPRSAADLAATIVHELQHSRLNVIMDLHRMCVRGADTNAGFFAPWRRDARPISGLLQGAYAFLAVADFWRGMIEAGISVSTACREFATARCQSAVVVRSIRSSDLLTRDGIRLAEAFAAWSARLDEVRVPAGVVDQAHEDLRLIHERWLRHNSGAA